MAAASGEWGWGGGICSGIRCGTLGLPRAGPGRRGSGVLLGKAREQAVPGAAPCPPRSRRCPRSLSLLSPGVGLVPEGCEPKSRQGRLSPFSFRVSGPSGTERRCSG